MYLALLLGAGATGPSPALASRGAQVRVPDSAKEPCTTDGLVHAEASAAITAHVRDRISLADPSSRIRGVVQLTFPCGFRLATRFGGNLILTDGKTFRRFLENNPFGFAPAFGFDDDKEESYQLRSEPVEEAALPREACAKSPAVISSRLLLCSGFGGDAAFFATSAVNGATDLSHYIVRGSQLTKDFNVGEIKAEVVSISFLPPPDAAGGTITVIISESGALYRAYIDVARG